MCKKMPNFGSNSLRLNFSCKDKASEKEKIINKLPLT